LGFFKKRGCCANKRSGPVFDTEVNGNENYLIDEVKNLNHLGTQTIKTERLILRKYKLADAEDMFSNWVTDPEASRFWGWEPHKDISETKALLNGWIKDYSKPDTYHWVIEHKNISQAVGYIYFNEIDDTKESVSVHYLLSRKFWNKGFMTEACKAVIEFAFSELYAKRVHTSHHIDNPASGRVQQKCGMRYVKTAYKHVPECEQLSGDYCYYECFTG